MILRAMIRALRMVALALCLAGPVASALTAPAAAQDQAQPVFDFEAWEKTASRAEEIIANAQASTPALETLRATLAEYRSKALDLQAANQARIDTLQAQLDALGPPPEEGQTEAPEVARRRAELTRQLADAKAPVLAAQEAWTRADGLIGEIDRIVRERTTTELLTLGPSPLNPAHWPTAWETLQRVGSQIAGEVDEALSSDAQRALVRQKLPAILALLVLGLLLLTRARNWLVGALGMVPLGRAEGGGGLRALVISTTRVVVPVIGLVLIVWAVRLTGYAGLRGLILLDAIPLMGVAIFGAAWLGRTLFDAADGTPVFLALDDFARVRARRAAMAMGWVVALHLLLARFAAPQDFPLEAHVVLSFPVILAGGLLLIRMGLLLEPAHNPAAQADNALNARFFSLLTRAAIAIGAVGPVLAAIGYFAASVALVIPAIETLALMGTMVIAYHIILGLWELLMASAFGRRAPAEGDERPLTLVPVGVGFALVLVALPILALIWGARVSDLQEVWTTISDGFTLGDRRISVTDFLTFAIVFAIGYTATRLAQSALSNSVLPRTRLDAGGRNAVVTGTGYLGIVLSAVIAIRSAGFDLSSLAIVAGALSVGVGFGLQAVVSNFVSGLILLVERPIKEGDWVEVGQYSGYVRKISVRSTEIQTFDRATVVVPNADFITGTVINWTHSSLNGRIRVPVGVSYDSDPEQVRAILQEIADSHPMVDPELGASVVFMGFGPDSMDFEIRAILKDVNNALSAKSDMNFEIVRRFREAGIEIPFAQRDIHLREPEKLAAALAGVGGPPARREGGDREGADTAAPARRSEERSARTQAADRDGEGRSGGDGGEGADPG